MKATILSIFILLTVSAYSQSSLNNYKYVLVPAKFDFLREEDQYGLNSATKMQLQLKGFEAFLTNEQLPPEVAGNKCNALTAEVVQKKGFLVTNLTVILKDCQGNIVFKSREGKSREKEFRPAFNLALQDAFTSLNDVAYKYDGTVAPAVQAGATPATSSSPAAGSTPASTVTEPSSGTLYAQAIANGYQLVDTTPKKVLTMLKSSVPDYYIVESEVANGFVFKKGGDWIWEYYKHGKLVSKKLEIRF